MEDFALFFFRDLLFEYVGMSIRWIFFFGKKRLQDLRKSNYNIIVSIVFYLFLFITIVVLYQI